MWVVLLESGTLPAGHIVERRMWVSLSKPCQQPGLPSGEKTASEQGKPQACESLLDIQGLGADRGVS